MDSEIPRISDIATVNAVYSNQANIKKHEAAKSHFQDQQNSFYLPHFYTGNRKERSSIISKISSLVQLHPQ